LINVKIKLANQFASICKTLCIC